MKEKREIMLTAINNMADLVGTTADDVICKLGIETLPLSYVVVNPDKRNGDLEHKMSNLSYNNIIIDIASCDVSDVVRIHGLDKCNIPFDKYSFIDTECNGGYYGLLPLAQRLHISACLTDDYIIKIPESDDTYVVDSIYKDNSRTVTIGLHKIEIKK